MELFQLTDDFVVFKERLELFFAVKDIKEAEKKKAHLLTNLSIAVYKLLRNMCSPKTPNENSYEQLVEMLIKQFVGKVVIFKERKRFYEMHQNVGESVLQYFNKIQAIAVNCDFGVNLDHILSDKFICGLRQGRIFERLCEEKSGLKSEEYLKTALAKEAAALTESEDNVNMHKIHNRISEPKQIKFNSSKSICAACGFEGHTSEKCKYSKYRCNKCKRKGHLAKMCKGHHKHVAKDTKRNHLIKACGESDEDNEINSSNEEEGARSEANHHLSLFSLVIDKQAGSSEAECKFKYRDYYQNIIYDNIVNTNIQILNISRSSLFMANLIIKGHDVQFEIDTGSAISAVPFSFYEKMLSNLQLMPFLSKLQAYNGGLIETSGYINANIIYNGKSYTVPFVVIKSGCRPLIGRDVFKLLKFKICSENSEICYIKETQSNYNSVEQICEKFSGFFNDKLGTYNGEKIDLKIASDIQPVFVRPRTVPFAFK